MRRKKINIIKIKGLRLISLLFVLIVLSLDSLSQDTTSIFTAFYAQQVNDSVIELWAPTVSDGYYGYIERKQTSQGNIWQQITPLDYMKFEEPLYDTFYYNCKDTLSYRMIQHISTFGDPNEISVSTERQFVVGDVEIPDMPENSLISVDINTQKLVFTFSSSTALDVLGYVICKGNPCVALDTVWGRESNRYECSTCNIEEVNQLAIMSFDSCYNTSLRSNKLNNMVLKARSKDCSSTLELSWNDYQNMPTGLNEYEIHVISNNNDEIVYRTQNTYCDVDVSQWHNNIFIYVKAVSYSNYFANSNKIEIAGNVIDTLEYINIDNVSVNMDNKTISLEISLDNSKIVDHYSLYRSKDGEEFKQVKTISYSTEPILFIEDNVGEEILNTTYSYYLLAPDVCGKVFTKSNIATTFKTNVEEINTKVNRITWNSCTLFPVAKYEVYRYEQSDVFPVLIGESNANSFEDVHGGMTSYADKLYYFVSAIERNNDLNPHISNSSRSYLKKESVFWVPDAFDPTEGVILDIQTFKPKIAYIKKDSYKFEVYNRWGTLLFSTSDVEQGWNGLYKGKLCDSGVYAYKIQFKNSEGKMETHSGTFILYN